VKKIIALVAGTAAVTVQLAPPTHAGLISCSQLGGALAGDGRQSSMRPIARPLRCSMAHQCKGRGLHRAQRAAHKAREPASKKSFTLEG
jgi:hypothetical protein